MQAIMEEADAVVESPHSALSITDPWRDQAMPELNHMRDLGVEYDLPRWLHAEAVK